MFEVLDRSNAVSFDSTLRSYSAPTLKRLCWAKLLLQRLSDKEKWKGRTNEKRGQSTRLVFFLLVPILVPSLSRAQDPPVFEITPVDSAMKFDVKASVAIAGKFDRWDATLTFTSPELSTAVLDIKIQAATVDTGSGVKNGKLKGKDFFDVEHNSLITFHSTSVIQTGPDTVEFEGDFTIRGVTKKEKLTFKITGRGTGQARLTGSWPSIGSNTA